MQSVDEPVICCPRWLAFDRGYD